MIKQTSISKTPWTFSPYNQSEWEKSKNRVMFVGADPNGAKKHKIKDMGKWFRKLPENKNMFYKRTMIMLNGILNHPHLKSDEDRMMHMRFVDLKIMEGGPKASQNEVWNSVKEHESIVNKFFSGKDYPHYIVFTGGISHSVLRLIKDKDDPPIKFNVESKAVLMPHPSSMTGYEVLGLASEKLNIHKSSNKFKPINENLWRWSSSTNEWIIFS